MNCPERRKSSEDSPRSLKTRRQWFPVLVSPARKAEGPTLRRGFEEKWVLPEATPLVNCVQAWWQKIFHTTDDSGSGRDVLQKFAVSIKSTVVQYSLLRMGDAQAGTHGPVRLRSSPPAIAATPREIGVWALGGRYYSSSGRVPSNFVDRMSTQKDDRANKEFNRKPNSCRESS